MRNACLKRRSNAVGSTVGFACTPFCFAGASAPVSGKTRESGCSLCRAVPENTYWAMSLMKTKRGGGEEPSPLLLASTLRATCSTLDP